jgi:tetratricopeptide (TPR) repeat protein
MGRLASLFALVWLALAPARPALADEDQAVTRAHEHFSAGQAFYVAGDYVSALREFEAARVIKAVPAFDYNIGVANEKLGHREDAIAAFRMFLDETVNPAEIADARARIARLQAEIAASKPGSPSPPTKQAPPPAAVSPPAVAPAPTSPPSYIAPAVVGIGALALAAVGVALYAPVTQEYVYAKSSFDKNPTSTPELQAQVDYMQKREWAAYGMFAAAGVAAVVDIVLFARTARARREAHHGVTAAAAPSRVRPLALGFEF